MVPFGQPSDNALEGQLSAPPVSRPCPSCFKVLRVNAGLRRYLAGLTCAIKRTNSAHKKSDHNGRFYIRSSASDLGF